MTFIKEIIEGIDTVTKTIDNIKKIREAVMDGKNYIQNKHPLIKKDLGLLLDELRKTIYGVAKASSILTNFRFAVSAGTMDSELVRFNNYFIGHKSEVKFLEDHLDELRGHCSKIRAHALKIADSSAGGFSGLFRKFGLNSPEREKELSVMLDRLAFEDFQEANSLQIIIKCLKLALTDIQNVLGDKGAMYPENLPKAAALLNEYSKKFEDLEKTALDNENDIKMLISELG